MITKLTADNAELYYAPRFAQITKAFEAAGKPEIQINSLEDYFGNLTEIAQLYADYVDESNPGVQGAFLLVAPADEDIFVIDANSRAIAVPAFVKKNGIGVYGDHRAEMIVFTIDRYFDHEDLLTDKIAINWNFTPSNSRTPIFETPKAQLAFAPNGELNPGKVTFGFIITKDMTPSRGNLTFSVTIYDTESNDIIYSFNTLTATVAINDTLTLLDPSMVEDDTANYLGRLTNSVYNDNTISPVGTPVWESGYVLSADDVVSGLKAGAKSGLDKVAYLPAYEDLNNDYRDGLILKSVASVDPNTADITYKWSYAPLNNNIEMGREFNSISKFNDFVEFDVPERDNGLVYYQKDAVGYIDTTNALTWAEAKAIADAAAGDADDTPYMNLGVSKLATVAADENQELSQANQDNMAIVGIGNAIQVFSKAELNEFASSNAAQGSGQWIGFDIDTGLDSIIGVKWGGNYVLNADDVAEASSVNLENGHLVFWVKANEIIAAPRTIRLEADGFKETTFTVQYMGVKPEENGTDKFIVVNKSNDSRFFVKGTSFVADCAGDYQAHAQARISAGNHFEKVLDGATLKVDKEYFIKKDGEIDELNPLVNSVAKAAQNAGTELFVRTSASRNSKEVHSAVLTIPAAVQPKVELSVASTFNFDDQIALNDDSIVREQADEEVDGELEYIYISNEQIPDIVATVTIDGNNEDAAGAIAVELITSDTAPLDLETINQKIAANELDFQAMPENGEFSVAPGDITEGEYVVRAINRRNATYAVSEPSKKIYTSFVAPVITNISLTAKDGSASVAILENGKSPNGSRIDLEISVMHDHWDYELVDNTENNFEDAVTSYFVEEVDLDSQTGEIIPRTEQKDSAEADSREIVMGENGIGAFRITRDAGYFRIKTVNRYHGTVRTHYSDLFGIKSYMDL